MTRREKTLTVRIHSVGLKNELSYEIANICFDQIYLSIRYRELASHRYNNVLERSLCGKVIYKNKSDMLGGYCVFNLEVP